MMLLSDKGGFSERAANVRIGSKADIQVTSVGRENLVINTEAITPVRVGTTNDSRR